VLTARGMPMAVPMRRDRAFIARYTATLFKCKPVGEVGAEQVRSELLLRMPGIPCAVSTR